jgi:ABC-type multidrug transport system ATPase subunit
MSTHSLTLAEQIAERIGIICRGKLIYDGTAASLKERHGLDLEETFLQLTAEGDDGSAQPGR